MIEESWLRKWQTIGQRLTDVIRHVIDFNKFKLLEDEKEINPEDI